MNSINNCRFRIFTLSGIILVLAILGCKKLVEADAPETSLSQANVYNNDASAISVLNGIYHQLSSGNVITGSNGLSLLAGLSSDEFTLSSEVPTSDLKYGIYIDSLYSNKNGDNSPGYWSELYNLVFRCNSAIEGLTGPNSLSFATRQQLLGEAKFIRAFCYFYLVNLYGDAPLVLSTDWETNGVLARTAKADVYQQIIADLKDAEELLSDKYLDANLEAYSKNAERVRPTKWAAIALLARAYLYTDDYANAEEKASNVINNTSLFGPISGLSLNSVFLKNSKEAIWQLQPVFSDRNTNDAIVFLLPSTGPSYNYPVFLSPQLLASFESGDQRRYNRTWVDSVTVGDTNPITYYFPYKYKAGMNSGGTSVSQLSEYQMMLRLSEQYLIRAEARTKQNNIGGAHTDLNAIRSRAGLPNTIANDQASLIVAIRKERQTELFSEIGNRWFDLKRSGTIDVIMSVVRPEKANGSPWSSWMQLYPIPFADIQIDPNLTQNDGY